MAFLLAAKAASCTPAHTYSVINSIHTLLPALRPFTGRIISPYILKALPSPFPVVVGGWDRTDRGDGGACIQCACCCASSCLGAIHAFPYARTPHHTLYSIEILVMVVSGILRLLLSLHSHRYCTHATHAHTLCTACTHTCSARIPFSDFTFSLPHLSYFSMPFLPGGACWRRFAILRQHTYYLLNYSVSGRNKGRRTIIGIPLSTRRARPTYSPRRLCPHCLVSGECHLPRHLPYLPELLLNGHCVSAFVFCACLCCHVSCLPHTSCSHIWWQAV